MASSLTQTQFQETLEKYPMVLEGLSRPLKDGQYSLGELDEFRYETAPMNFSKTTGRNMELSDLKKLIEWKIRHGQYRPMLLKWIASNSEKTVTDALSDAFTYYADNQDDITGTLKKLSGPLKGVGPAAASLILSIHDPQHVVFFSDELFYWLTSDGDKVKVEYNLSEFALLMTNAKEFMSRINCTPIELEKVAFVLVHEKDLSHTIRKPAYVPTGKPRGRPALSEDQKKDKAIRATRDGERKPSEISPRRSTRRVSSTSQLEAKKRDGRKAQGKPGAGRTLTAVPKKRGRPSLASQKTVQVSSGAIKKRGRPRKSPVDAELTTKSGRKRKAEKDIAKSAKKAKT